MNSIPLDIARHRHSLPQARVQFVDGHLGVHGWRCSIYLVGWFIARCGNALKITCKATHQLNAATALAELAAEFDGVTSKFRVETCLFD